MSRTSNDPTRISSAHKDGQRLTEFLFEKFGELREEATTLRYIDAILAMSPVDARRFVTLMILQPHLLRQLPRLDI